MYGPWVRVPAGSLKKPHESGVFCLPIVPLFSIQQKNTGRKKRYFRNMRKIYSIILLALVCSSMFGQAKWSKRLGGPSFEEGLDIDTDVDGNSYTVGYFSGIANMTGQYYSSNGLYDGFVIKNDSSGVLQFVKKIGGSNNDKVLSIDVSSNGDFAVTGYFSESLTLDNTTINAAGEQDIFVAKFESNGNLIWIKNFGGSNVEQGNAIHHDNNGNLIITGEFSGTCDFGGIALTAVSNSIDVFILKLNSQGEVLWVKKGSGSATDRGVDVAIDDNGGIYVCGEFSDTVEFDVVHNNQMYNAMFLIKYSPSGQEQWFRHMGSGSQLNAGSIAIKNNNLYFTGDFDGTLYFIINKDPSNSLEGIYENALFLVKYDLNGNIIWKTANSSMSDIRCGKVVIDNNNKIYVAGDFLCQFNEYADEYGSGIFISQGSWDNFITQFDQQGNWVEARQYGGRYTDYLYSSAIKNNQLITTGSFIRDYLITVNPYQFIQYGTNNLDYNLLYGGGSYCNDPYYYHYVNLMGAEQNSGLHSDVFINSAIDFNRAPMDFFSRSGLNCNRDFIEPQLYFSYSNIPVQDSVINCGTPGIYVYQQIYDWWLRPNIVSTWSNGVVNWESWFGETGNYSVHYEYLDGCYIWEDTVHVTYNPNPEVPLISDNLQFNNSNYYTTWVYACQGDTVQLWSPNYNDTMVSWTLNNVPINPDEVLTTGDYYVRRTIPSTGCYNYNAVHVEFKDSLSVVEPKIKITYNGSVFESDTLHMCLGESFNALFYDSLTNPLADINTCFPDLSSVNWISNDSIANAEIGGYLTQTNCSAWNMIPTYPGIYVNDFAVELVRYNPCGTEIETVHRRIVFNVHELEDFEWDFQILPEVPLCPGESPYFYLSDSTLHVKWEYCNDCWSGWESTAYYPDAGGHNVYVVDTIPSDWGCSFVKDTMLWLEVTEHPQLVINTNPMNAIICPFDSVLINANSNLIQYWVGPDGNIPNTTSTFYTETPGNYYAVADYGEDCNVVSNTVELIQYNTPYLLASPYGVICNGNPVTITVQTTEGSVVNWLPPLSGSNMSQTITEIGTYTCSIDACNIYTEISMNVIIDSMDLFIESTDEDLTFCPGDSIVLMGPDNLATYQWTDPLNSELGQLYVNEPGIYTLIGASGSGCRDTTSIVVNMFNEYPEISVMEDTTICAREEAFLHAASGDNIIWCNSNSYTDYLSNGPTYTTPHLFDNQTYYVYASTANCQSEIYEITVIVDDHCREIDIPNIFTPDDDGHNDCFPDDEYDYDLDLDIYDRWGKKVFHKEKLKGGWKGLNNGGQKLNNGTYFYVIKATFYDGETETYQGDVMILEK